MAICLQRQAQELGADRRILGARLRRRAAV
jgi:hypothetical protein